MADLEPLPQRRATRAGKLAATGLAVFLAAGLASNAWLALTPNAPLLPREATAQRVLAGDVSRDLAGRMADAPLPAGSARLQRALGWLALGDLGPRVRQGCPGWLFLRDELAVQPDGDSHAAARAKTVADVRHDLAVRGIKLLVVIVPDKSRIESDHLCGLHRPAELDARLGDWAASIGRQGAQVLDLGPVLGGVLGDPYFRTDTHWTEEGAGAAARAVARSIRAMGVSPRPGMSYYRVESRPVARRPGDLVRLAGLDGLPADWQPRPEIVASHDYVPQAQVAASADDLFGDEDLPGIVVIGTSYSRTSGFVPQLSQALGADVGNFARDGGMFGGAAQAYFASQAYARTPPELIVWEVNERDLQAPLQAADKVVVPPR